MDSFKQKGEDHCGIGGRKCECCNCFKGKERNKLNRIARRTLKDADRKKFKKDIDEKE